MRPHPQPEPGVERIAIVRANVIGDLVVALPALEAVRAAYPDAEIVLCAREWHRGFLAGRPSPVDRVEVIPGPVADVPANEVFFAERAAEHFDLAIQLHGGGRDSNPFTRALGARLAIGTRAPDAIPLDRNLHYEYWHHEPLRWLEVVRLAGAKPVTLEPHLAVTAADRAEAAAVLPPHDRPLVVLHPGATDGRRRWPPEKFAAVGDRLAAAGAELAIVGTGEDADIVGAVINGMCAPAVDLSGRLGLSGLVGLLARAALLVGNDSGPRHLAEAVGTPTVGVYWCGNVTTAGPMTRAQHRPILSWTLRCPRCGVDCMTGECAHDDSFVASVDIEEVAGAALDLLVAE